MEKAESGSENDGQPVGPFWGDGKDHANGRVCGFEGECARLRTIGGVFEYGIGGGHRSEIF